MTHPAFTMRDVYAMSTIVEMAEKHHRVIRLLPELNQLVVYGTARHICDPEGNFIPPKADVRDYFLRVTTNTGFEAFWPITELIEDVHSGTFVINRDV